MILVVKFTLGLVAIYSENTLKNNPLPDSAENWTDAWWRHQIETFSALLASCAGNSPVTREIPIQRPMTRSFGVFFDLSLNKRLRKKWWGWWFETPSRSIWCQCNGKHLDNMHYDKNGAVVTISFLWRNFPHDRSIYGNVRGRLFLNTNYNTLCMTIAWTVKLVTAKIGLHRMAS